MEQMGDITGNRPSCLWELLGGAAFRGLWANMRSKECGAKREPRFCAVIAPVCGIFGNIQGE